MEQNSGQKHHRHAGISRVSKPGGLPVAQPIRKTINFPENCLFEADR
jgi:hypothetical protein